jgi:hypothetical protein
MEPLALGELHNAVSPPSPHSSEDLIGCERHRESKSSIVREVEAEVTEKLRILRVSV